MSAAPPPKSVKALAVIGLHATKDSKTDLRIQVLGAALAKGDELKLSASTDDKSFEWTADAFLDFVPVKDPNDDKNTHYVQKVTVTCTDGRSSSDGASKKLRGEDDLVVVNVTVTSGETDDATTTTSTNVAYLLP